MGKVAKRRYKVKSRNPTGIVSLKELESGEDTMCSSAELEKLAGMLTHIVEKLKSNKNSHREQGAYLLAHMAKNKEFVASLIKQKVIKLVSPLLLDKNLSVRHLITGCLRNIAVCGDYTVSEAMIEQDVMTSLLMLFEQYKDPWTPVKNPGIKIDSKREIFFEACTLLWTLCENSSVAVSLFNKNNLSSILLPCLNVEIYGSEIPVAVAQCLFTVSENNPHFKEILQQPMVEMQLQALMSIPTSSPQHILLKTLASGMIQNVYAGKLDNCMSHVTTSILKVISSAFYETVMPYLEILFTEFTSCESGKSVKNPVETTGITINENGDLERDENDDENFENVVIKSEETEEEKKKNAIKKAQANVVDLLSAKQTGLEILGNMFGDADDEDEWDDISSSDSSEIVYDGDVMEVDQTDVSPKELGLELPLEIRQFIVNENLLQKVTEQIITPPDSVVDVLKEHPEGKECLKRFESLRCVTLLCLNNIIQKFSIEHLGGPTKLLDLWHKLGNLLISKTDLNNIEAVTHTLSAVLRKLAEADCSSHFSNMTELDLELLLKICRQSEDSNIKVNIIRILGTLGCFFGKINSPTSYVLIKTIGTELLEICSKNMDIWVVAEALDVIFDVFAEDHIDNIAREINLVDQLTHILPILKTKVKQQKKAFGDHLPVIMTAKENLFRFIKYKNNFNKK